MPADSNRTNAEELRDSTNSLTLQLAQNDNRTTSWIEGFKRLPDGSVCDERLFHSGARRGDKCNVPASLKSGSAPLIPTSIDHHAHQPSLLVGLAMRHQSDLLRGP
jgi:hypothetical protein